MNKKLVAVAVAALLAAPMAQAQTANVVLYGRLNLDLEYIDASGNLQNISRLSANSSRFGIRGTEALGGGLSAIFQVESSLSADAGGGTLAGRDTFVGLQGSWGTVRFGNFLAPYDDMHPIFGNGPSYLTSILATAALWANNGGQSKTSGSFDARLPNSIRYDMPNIAGFTGGVQLSLWDDSGAGGRNDAWILSAAGIYKNGPFEGGIAYEMNKDVRFDCGGCDDWAFTATAAWNFGIIRVVGLYERLDYDTPTGSLKRNLWGIGANGPVGVGTWQAMYQQANDGSGGGSRVGGFTSGSDTGAYHFTASYNHPLSKRTAVYVGYSRIDNDSNAGYNFNINPYSGGTVANPIGATYNGFVGGIVHNF